MKVYSKGKIIEYLEHLIAEFMLKTKQKKVDTKPLIPPVSFKYFPSLSIMPNFRHGQTVTKSLTIVDHS